MLEVDEASHRAMMHASGTVKRGQGGATATIVSKLTESAAGGTHVEVQTEYKITGSLARFGRGGMIEDISERLLREFAGRLAAMLAAPEAAGGRTGLRCWPCRACGAVATLTRGRARPPRLPPTSQAASPPRSPTWAGSRPRLCSPALRGTGLRLR